MMQIHFHGVSGTLCNQEPLTVGRKGLTISFSFDGSWDGLSKTAVFRGCGRKADVTIPESGTVEIPQEILRCVGGRPEAAVYGSDQSGDVVLPSRWISLGQVLAGAKLSESQEEDNAGDPETTETETGPGS